MYRHAFLSRLARAPRAAGVAVAASAGLLLFTGVAPASALAATATQTALTGRALAAETSASASSVVIGQPVAFGSAPQLGSMAGHGLNSPIVAIASTPKGDGYWLVAADGGVFNYGAAHFYGSAGNIHLNSPIVAMASAPDGKGYWLVAADGGVFNYGSAHFFGSAGGIHLNSPIVGIAATADGTGYWLVAADGGIFTYGTAHFKGSAGGIHLNSPIVGMAPAADEQGYWLVAADGGIFTYGSARFHGSAGGIHLNSPIVAMAVAAGGDGYWLAASDGGVFTFGQAHFRGSLSGSVVADAKAEISSIVANPTADGYWLLPVALPPPPPPPAPPVEPVVSEGDCGAAVLTLQQELTALGYWVGTPSGCFGDSTQQAVWALQKAAGLSTDGVAGQATWDALFHKVLPTPRPSSASYLIEVNLATDLVMVVSNGKVEYVLNTSTGGGYTYYENGATDVAITPTGVFNTYTAVDGLVTDSLGQLWMPRYFYEGFAIHGDGYVPPVPVSHGCVRVSNEAIEWIWSANIDPIGTEVWVYN
jgi:peptidoglycan hydrolase-like protein with peptidoglycan-binding domain